MINILAPMILVSLTMAGHSNVPFQTEDRALNQSLLKPCPATPNCVCSDAASGIHGIAPFLSTTSDQELLQVIRRYVLAQPRWRILDESPGYLHVEAKTRLLRFVDDVQFELRGQGVVAIRSASRRGTSDFGTNRRRLEKLRRDLVAQGALIINPNSGGDEDCTPSGRE